MAEKHFVIDTNILIGDPSAIFNFDEHTIVIPMTVLQELDKIKSQKDRDCSRDARMAIRQIDEIVGDATHEEIVKGIPLNLTQKGLPDTAKLAIFPDHTVNFSAENYLQNPSNDDTIINVALHYQNEGFDVTLVTNDINMRLKAKGCGIEKAERYSADKSVQDLDVLPKGHRELDFDFWEKVGDSPDTKVIHFRHYYTLDRNIFPQDVISNEYFTDTSGNILLKVTEFDDEKIVIEDISLSKSMSNKIWGIHPKDLDQAIAIHMLMDTNLDLVTILGSAGTGKTLLTVAAGLEQVFEKNRYDRIIFSRTTDSQFADMGFLPGSEFDKLSPHLGGIFDALEFLHKGDKNPTGSVQYLFEGGKLQMKALNFIRGRSFQDTILVIDEAQNLTADNVRTIITRAGQNCKVVLLGNLSQIDNNYITPLSSGLTYAVEKTKEYEGAGVIIMENVVRSRLAAYAEDNL